MKDLHLGLSAESTDKFVSKTDRYLVLRTSVSHGTIAGGAFRHAQAGRC